MRRIVLILALLSGAFSLRAAEYYVAKSGCDRNDGTSIEHAFLTIQRAADVALPGDIITVYGGVYRERIDPKRGGFNALTRITYQAAEGERVEIKGSEQITGWRRYKGDIWCVEVDNSLFNGWNPFEILLEGDSFINTGITHHLGEVYLNEQAMFEQNSIDMVLDPVACEWSVDREASLYTWYAEVGDESTKLWANFKGANPNKELVEINVREACFYPKETAINYITVRGFKISQAATSWGPGFMDQIGALGSHWSRGWIIENNEVYNSKSTGISIGKEGPTSFDCRAIHQPDKPPATRFNELTFRLVNIGWGRELVGEHIVRNNTIYNCGCVGIAGAFGAIFSEITDNHIYNIYTRRAYTGMCMAGIKLMGAINVLVDGNIIHDTHNGIWLDWMIQGVRISKNILYNNDQYDLHDEVNHGPFMVDNNLFLSKEGVSIMSRSQGTAYVHNLFGGWIKFMPVMTRTTPYFLANSTVVKGVSNIPGGDNRFYNNIFIGVEGDPDISRNRQIKGADGITNGLSTLDQFQQPSYAAANLYYNEASSYKDELDPIHSDGYKASVTFEQIDGGVIVTVDVDDAFKRVQSQIVTTDLLGATFTSFEPYMDYDAEPFFIDHDFYSKQRNTSHPTVGPFEGLKEGVNIFRYTVENK